MRYFKHKNFYKEYIFEVTINTAMVGMYNIKAINGNRLGIINEDELNRNYTEITSETLNILYNKGD